MVVREKTILALKTVPMSGEGGVFFESREPFRSSPPTPVPVKGARNMQWILVMFISLARCI